MSGIKPCPFCGSNEVEPFKKVNHELFGFCCWNCGAESGLGGTEKRAIEKWNQRPYDFDMPAIVKKIQQLQFENDKMKAALKIYASRDEWSSEARFEYETGNFLATGDYEIDEGSVCLDGDLYWCGHGNDGYELAERVLEELESCKQLE